jgi:hypothetical protein
MTQTFLETEMPTRSPWGPVQSGERIAQGIWMVHTAGHGGIKLSRERNRLMPDYMRSPGGWYEEDSQWSLTALVFAEEFKEKVNSNGRSWYDYALESARHSYPDQYEEFFGVVLTPEESNTRARQAFERETHDRFVVSSAWGDWAAFVPQGKVGVVARRRSDDAEAWFLIDAELYRQKQTHGFVIDLHRDRRIAKPSNPGQTKAAAA